MAAGKIPRPADSTGSAENKSSAGSHTNTRSPPDSPTLLQEEAGHRHDRVFEPNTTSKLDVREKGVTVPAKAAPAATIGIAAATGLVLFFMGAAGVHLRAHEHHDILTTVGYVQL